MYYFSLAAQTIGFLFFKFFLGLWSSVLSFHLIPQSSKSLTSVWCPTTDSFFFFLNFIYLFLYLFLAVLGLGLCARALSSCSKRGPLFITVRGRLTIAASLVVEHRLQMHRLGSRGSRAQLLRSMWDPPRPGLEPMSPALAGRLSTTVPPGKPQIL